MAHSVLNDVRFHNEKAALSYVEAQLWPNGPVCPHCDATGEKIGKLQGKSTRAGLYKCYACRKPFTVRIGTIFEDSHLPLRLWLQAIHLMCASKKGISTRQLQRMLGCGMKTAWHLGHRIREAMADELPKKDRGRLGGSGKIVEMDETYFGKADVMHVSHTRQGRPFIHRGMHKNNRAVIALVERGGSVRSFNANVATQWTVENILADNLERQTTLHTDESNLYNNALMHAHKHETVKHTAGEYVRGDVHTNTIENYFSVFKRGMRGVYQHCQEKHLHRYLAEFDFRYNTRVKLGVNDVEREAFAVKGGKGKRLTYQTTNRPEAQA
jgi:transposase-like protein